MKSALLSTLFLLLLIPKSGPAEAIPGTLCAGLDVGSLSGLAFKYWITRSIAMDVAIGAPTPYALSCQVSYLWHLYDVFRGQGGELAESLPLYFGGGAQLVTGSVWPYGVSAA